MWRSLLLVMCCGIATADEPKKPEPPKKEVKKETRDEAEKRLKEQIAKTGKKLAEAKEDMAVAANAAIGGSGEGKLLNGGRHQVTQFASVEKKKAKLAEYKEQIDSLTFSLNTDKAALKELQKPPKKPDPPKPEPTPPKKPEAKP